MALTPGTRLGPYEVVSPLGAGGMGEVYRARDTKLDRDVALKVLPEAFTADPDRLARFQREAKVLASLNHPHIGHIYGLEEADGQKALVLELVEGPTLADRIAQGALPLDEALPIAKQIAEALEAAHEQGIIHRDLKPANVKVRPDGTVKVLDFGLAKAYQAEGDDADDSQSPTLSARATQAGVILGTAAYMSPEQAAGKAADSRSDVWSFGVLLFEMLTGRRLFSGETTSETLAAVLKDTVDLEPLSRSTPPSVLRLLRRALERDRRRRVQHMGDARLEIEEAQDGDGSDNEAPSRLAALLSRPRLLLALAAVAVAVTLILGFVLGRGGHRGTPPAWSSAAPTTWTEVTLPASASLSLGTRFPLVGFESPVVALSPDGRHLVYVGQSGEGTLLYHRDLTKAEGPRPVPGTEEALFAFFSPDSSELGFLTSDRVRKVALDGRAATTLSGARMPVFATWMGQKIYFADASGTNLMMVPATGGEPTQLYSTAPSGWGFVRSVLPGGQAALVSLYSPLSTSLDFAPIRIVFFDGREDRPLPVTGFDPRILPDGHLIFGRGGTLFAAPFDAEHLELRGDPVPVLEGAAMESIFGNLHIAVSDNGALAVVPGRDVASGRLAWVDRQGRQGTLKVPDRVYGTFDMTADEKKFAVQVADVQDYVWIWDVEAGGRALPYAGAAGWPLWSPPADALAFVAMHKSGASKVTRASKVMRQDFRGGPAQELFASDEMLTMESWVRPGLIGVTGFVPSRVGALEDRPPNGSRWIESREDGSLGVWGGSLSPGGEWIAYMSKEGTGRDQVWIEEVDGGTRRQVSTDGGVEPVWCLSCGELFYRQGNRIFASRIKLDPQLEVGPPRQAFVAPDFVDTGGLSYRVSADGERLYYVRRQPTVRDRILITQNWFPELDRLAPSDH